MGFLGEKRGGWKKTVHLLNITSFTHIVGTLTLAGPWHKLPFFCVFFGVGLGSVGLGLDTKIYKSWLLVCPIGMKRIGCC